jgi:hypothetical protein
MDDRFDLQLLSEELWDGAGLDYVEASYRVFGNNGTHALGQAITTGTGAAPNVLSALTTVSDHLPVVADYVIIPESEPLAGDLDGDGDVDPADFALFGQCFGGSMNPPAKGCPPGVNADLDDDGDVDSSDLAILAQNFTGSM